MARVLLTGMSGTGKSTILDALRVRGHVTVDTDYDDWQPTEGMWDARRMDELLAAHTELVVAGTAENQGRFYDRFQHVVLLSAPAEVLIERVRRRTNNPYGTTPAQQAEILGYLQTVEPLLRAGATLELDAREPVAGIVETIERLMSDGGRPCRQL